MSLHLYYSNCWYTQIWFPNTFCRQHFYIKKNILPYYPLYYCPVAAVTPSFPIRDILSDLLHRSTSLVVEMSRKWCLFRSCPTSRLLTVPLSSLGRLLSPVSMTHPAHPASCYPCPGSVWLPLCVSVGVQEQLMCEACLGLPGLPPPVTICVLVNTQ